MNYIKNFIFKNLNKNNLNYNISEIEQNTIINNLINYKETDNKLYNELIINDLEIFENKSSQIKNTLFNIINKTTTKCGKKYLEEMIKYPTSDIAFLNYRQNIIKKLSDKLLFKKIKNKLENIKLLESDFFPITI